MNEYNPQAQVLLARMTNGHPFLRTAALERINALANDLAISQAEADELTALANQYGADILPDDTLGRLEAVEQTTDELTLMMADLIGGASV